MKPRVSWDKVGKMWIVARYYPSEFVWKVASCHATEAEARAVAGMTNPSVQ